MRMVQSFTGLALTLSLLRFGAVSAILPQHRARVCDEDGTCDDIPSEPMCGITTSCVHSSKSLYDHKGGSAQAYKPNAPVKNEVCEIDSHLANKGINKVATNPFWRSSRRIRPGLPKIEVIVDLYACDEEKAKKGTKTCCCTHLQSNEEVVLEVWQPRPDGTYSSLKATNQNGDCRATVPVSKGQARFTTLPPGSTGSLGGLGPNGREHWPYGFPVIHMLVSGAGVEPLLVHVPMLMHPRTLEQQAFWGPDWRGPAYFTKSRGRGSASNSYMIDEWNLDKDQNILTVSISLFLVPKEASHTNATTIRESLHSALCPSYMYGFPSSFFTEPIAVCSPSTLDFFAL